MAPASHKELRILFVILASLVELGFGSHKGRFGNKVLLKGMRCLTAKKGLIVRTLMAMVFFKFKR